MSRTKLVCCFCGDPIRQRDPDPDTAYDVQTEVSSGIERAWHDKCSPAYAPPDTPWQAAVQKLKQAVADARRLPPAEESAFWEVFEQVRGQRGS